MNFRFNGQSLLCAEKKVFSEFSVSACIDEKEHQAILSKADKDTFVWLFPEKNLEWHWQLSFAEGRLRVANQFVNAGNIDVRLGKTFFSAKPDCLLNAKGVVFSTFFHGENSRKKFLPDFQLAAAVDSIKDSAVKIDFYVAEQDFALQLAFLSFQRVLSYVNFSSDAHSEVALVTVGMDFAGWILASSQSTSGELFSLAFSSDPFALLEDWATQAAKLLKPKFRQKPAIGITAGSSWGLGRYKNREETCLAKARAAVEQLKGFDLEFVWLSIANLPGGNPGAWQSWNEKNFPSGLEFLVAELSKLGLKLGFWFGPFMLSTHLTDLVAELDEAILRNPEGEKLNYYPVWSHGDAGLLPRAERPACYALDPSHPKTQNFLRESLQKYYQSGIRYYMMDFLEAGAGHIQRHKYLRHYDSRLVAGPEVLSAGLQVVREASGPDCYLLASTGPFLFDTGFVDAIRTGNDFGEGRRIMPDSGFYPASYVINGSFTAAAMALQCAAVQYYTHNKLYQNDSGNMLTVDLPIPLESARIHATIHAMSGSSSMLGDALWDLSEERLSLIKKTLPRDTVMAKPIDLFTSVPEGAHFFLRKIEQEWGSYRVLAIYNFSANSKKESISFKDLDLAEDVACQVWELWNENYHGTVKQALEVEIPAESVRVFRLTPMLDRPMLIGTNLHLLMGLKEVLDCLWNEQEMSLTIKLTRPSGEKGGVFFHMPEGWNVKNHDEFHIARNRNGTTGEMIVYSPCNFETEILEKKIFFGRYGIQTK